MSYHAFLNYNLHTYVFNVSHSLKHLSSIFGETGQSVCLCLCLSVSAHLHTVIIWGCWWALIHFNSLVRDCIMFCFRKYENYLQLWRNNPHNSSESLPLLLVGSTPYLISTHYSVYPPCMQKDHMIDAVQGCYFHKRGRLNPVTQEWWGTSELRRQYISPHQIIYCPLFCSYIYINNVAKRRDEGNRILMFLINLFIRPFHQRILCSLGILQEKTMLMAFLFHNFL